MVEMSLSDDVLRQLGVNTQLPTEDGTKLYTEFDAKGTLHVKCYDEDGKPLKDIPIKNPTSSYESSVTPITSEEIASLNKKSKRMNVLFLLAWCLLGVVTICCFILITRLAQS